MYVSMSPEMDVSFSSAAICSSARFARGERFVPLPDCSRNWGSATRATRASAATLGGYLDARKIAAEREALSKASRCADPSFWNNQEAAQSVLRERKRAEEQIAADEKLTSISGDIETYIHLAQEETNVEQKNDLLKELDRELNAADTYISELETKTLLSGETDHLNAIMTIKPGAGGPNRRTGHPSFFACTCDGRNAGNDRLRPR